MLAVLSGEYQWLSCVYFCVPDIADVIDIHKFFHQSAEFINVYSLKFWCNITTLY